MSEEIVNLVKDEAIESVPMHGEIVRNLPKAVAQLIPDRNTVLSQCPTNIPLDTKHGRALLINCCNPGDIKLRTNESLDIVVKYYVCYPDSTADEKTGEMKEFTRYAFVTPKGEIFRTSGEHTYKRISAMLSLFSKEEWEKGIPLRITARPSDRKGRSDWHEIKVNYPEGE
jgi:hypothetical protein